MFNEVQELADFKTKLNKIIEITRQELQALRTGKASPSLVENMVVETYGGTTKLKIQELASITTDGPNGLLISPFDSSTSQDIEKAILASPLHLTPKNEGKVIRLIIPPLSEEQRKLIIKVVSQKIEEGKGKIRMGRDEIRRKTKSLIESKDITEDAKFRVEKDVDKAAQEYSVQLDEIKEKKEKELMEI